MEISFTVLKHTEENKCTAVVIKPWYVSESPGGLIKIDCWIFNSVNLEQGLGLCMANKFPSDAAAVGVPETTFWEPLEKSIKEEGE